MQLFEAEDGQAAIDILDSEAIDLVVTDINMPKVNGLMLLAYVNAFFPALPFTVTLEEEMEPCHLFINDGVLLDAVMGDRRGEKVAAEAMARADVTFSLERGCPDTIRKGINRPLGELVEASAAT
ncbi:MAG: response regulator [Desulfobacterales bacterium]|nr:response regulator [Desulfobacterales bacterium]